MKFQKINWQTVIGNCGNNKKIGYSCCDQTETAITYSEYGLSTAMLEFNGQTLTKLMMLFSKFAESLKILTLNGMVKNLNSKDIMKVRQ